MARFYVKNKKNKWNIYSSIIDDFLFDKWLSFDELVKSICDELIEDKTEELNSLLTDKPKLNIMSYEEAMKNVELKDVKTDE